MHLPQGATATVAAATADQSHAEGFAGVMLLAFAAAVFAVVRRRSAAA